MTTDLIPYRRPIVDVAQAATWGKMDKGERKRRVMKACQLHDQATLLDLAESWLVLQGQAGARVSANTRGSYRTGITQMLKAFAQVSLLHPEDGAANQWVRGMEEAGLKPATVRARKAAARSLYKALRWAGATDADPFADVHVARDLVEPWDKRSPYEDGEVNQLLAYACAHDEHQATGLVVLLGADTGLRVSEMCALRWQDINLRQSKLTVENGKGGKMRKVDMSPRLVRYLMDYRGATSSAAYVLPYRARSTPWKHLNKLCDAAGVDRKALHPLRHTAGTRIVASGLSLEDAAQHLGHAHIETTRSYAKWSNKTLKKMIDTWE